MNAKLKYHQRPEARAKRKVYDKEYNQRPYVKENRKGYSKKYNQKLKEKKALENKKKK